MRNELLSLRVSRRAIGAAVLTRDGVTVVDSRHLRSNTNQAVAAATAFVERLLQGSAIRVVAIDRPADGSSAVGDAFAEQLHALASARGIRVTRIDKQALLAAYGLTPVPSRAALRPLVAAYWPDLARRQRPLTPHVLDAAAAGLFAECRLALHPPHT
jgi:hypothetical protein